MEWNLLSMAERALYILMGVLLGITNLSDIHSIYSNLNNEQNQHIFGLGGSKKNQKTSWYEDAWRD